MLYRIGFAPLISVAVLLSASCQSAGEKGQAASAQSIVEGIAHEHPNVVRLTLHAVPRGESQARAIASTSAARRGKPSDPEDLRAMESGVEIVLQEGENLEVTVPLSDAAGKRTSVTGVTLRPAGRTREQLIAEARVIADELSSAIRAAKQPLW